MERANIPLSGGYRNHERGSGGSRNDEGAGGSGSGGSRNDDRWTHEDPEMMG